MERDVVGGTVWGHSSEQQMSRKEASSFHYMRIHTRSIQIWMMLFLSLECSITSLSFSTSGVDLNVADRQFYNLFRLVQSTHVCISEIL
jgi:hypothetical protein